MNLGVSVPELPPPSVPHVFMERDGLGGGIKETVRFVAMPDRKPLSFEDVEILEAAGLYELATVARKQLRPRRRWYRFWRLSAAQRGLQAKLGAEQSPTAERTE